MIKYSPAMQQYIDIKQKHPDKIIFFRLGDFYEFFFDDAITCSKILDLVLTKKKAGSGQLVDMAGVPHHSYKEYAKKLVENGYKVAIVEQMQDPKDVKGIVDREVCEIITPSTISLEQNDDVQSYLCAIKMSYNVINVAYFNIVTNDIFISTFDTYNSMFLELETLNIKEIILDSKNDKIDKYLSNLNIARTIYKRSKISDVVEFGKDYLSNILNQNINLFKQPVIYKDEDHFLLTKSTLDNLEFFNDDVKQNLFKSLNNTKTLMGSRLLSNMLRRPLLNKKLIDYNLDQIEYFINNPLIRMEITSLCEKIFDIDKLNTRIQLNKISPKGLLKLKESIDISLQIAKLNNNEKFNELEVLSSIISESLLSVENITNDRYINPNNFEELNSIFLEALESKNWLINYEQDLKNKYELKSLKVGFNKIFGYYLELPKAQAKNAPEFFIRKQTLVNNERFITEEMKEKEDIILNSEQRYQDQQLVVYNKLVEQIKKYFELIRDLSSYIAECDVQCANATLSKQQNLVRPKFTDFTNVIDSRHLTIEQLVGRNNFVSNSYNFDDKNIIILTGPNMSGKSTYMRQIALVQILAQCGLFVPATEANLEIVDQVFTRIGAGDDLSSGKSTFLVEMEETSYALRNATDKSLIILD